MKVKAKKDFKYSLNGIEVTDVKEGQEVEILDCDVDALKSDGRIEGKAEEKKESKKVEAPENKQEKPEEKKDELKVSKSKGKK